MTGAGRLVLLVAHALTPISAIVAAGVIAVGARAAAHRVGVARALGGSLLVAAVAALGGQLALTAFSGLDGAPIVWLPLLAAALAGSLVGRSRGAGDAGGPGRSGEAQPVVDDTSGCKGDEPRRAGLSRPLYLGMIGAVFLLGLQTVLDTPLNHDVAWCLYVGGRVVDGAHLYRDVVEVNPPLIIWLSALVVGLSRVLGTSVISVFPLVAAALFTACTALWDRALRAAGVETPLRRVCVLVLVFVLLTLPGIDFGQREEVMLAAFAPFLALAAARARGRDVSTALALGAGLVGAVGLALKPFFLAPWLGVELYLLVRAGEHRPRLRPELVVIVVSLTLYVGVVLLTTPEYLALVRWARPLYAYFGTPSLLALVRTPATLVVAVTVLAALLLPGNAAGRELRRVWVVALAGFALALVWQGKGWSYHWYPVIGSAILLGAATLMDAARPWLVSAAGGPALAAAPLMAFILAGAALRDGNPAFRAQFAGEPYYLAQLLPIVAQEARGGAIAALGMQMHVAFPLVQYAQVGWGLRYPCLWFLPGLYGSEIDSGRDVQMHTPERMTPTERALIGNVVDDLVAARPRILLVDLRPPTHQFAGFDYLRYFAVDPRFAALLRGYRARGQISHWLILARMDSARASTAADRRIVAELRRPDSTAP